MGRGKSWTEADEKLLLQFEFEGKSTEFMMDYFGRSFYSIESKLDKLHSKMIDRSNEPSSSRKLWTKQLSEELATLIDEGKTTEELAEYFGRSETAIVVKAGRLGKQIKSTNRTWTPEDEKEFAVDWYDSTMSIPKMCKKYTRTWFGLRKRAQILDLGARPYNTEYVSVPDICEEMQVSNDRVYSWFKMGLPRIKNRSGKTKYVVDIDELLKFLEKHQDLFQADKISIYLFHDEPDWLVEKRKRDIEINISKRRLPYTNEEDKLIAQMFYSGKSDEEIAIKLNRTTVGVTCHRLTLCLTKNKFMDYEIDILKKYSRYKTIYELAKMLPLRTPKGISYKCEELGIPYHISKNKCEKEEA